MATNNPKISQARVMTMFRTIRSEEMKNVRTLQYESKDMVKRITDFIVKQADEAAAREKEAEGK